MKTIKISKWTILLRSQSHKILLGLFVLFSLLISNQARAQGGFTNGDPSWIGGNGKLYVIGAKVGIGTNSPTRSLHSMGAGHRYMRVSSTGGTQFYNYVAGLELQRTLDNGQTLLWDLVNQDGFKIRRNTITLFHMKLNEAQFGTQSNKTTMNIWGDRIINNSGSLDKGTVVLRNMVSGQYQTLRLDGNQIESVTDLHINSQSNKDVDLANGGGKVRIGTNVDDNAKVSVSAEGMQLRLMNDDSQKTWRIGASNPSWFVGDGKLVFSHTESSNDATMVMTQQGQVGIGMTTPNRTLDVDGSIRAKTLEITGVVSDIIPSLTVNGKTSTKILEITGGADLAEPFEIVDESAIRPGMVVSIDPVHAGQLKMTNEAYDKAVAGIVSGAGDIQPGMVMGQDGTIANGEYPVALTGRVYCQVDATYGPIQPGDLLTTSGTPGHAMKVIDHQQAQGAIIGKAMTSLEDGQGLVLVLVSLQ